MDFKIIELKVFSGIIPNISDIIENLGSLRLPPVSFVTYSIVLLGFLLSLKINNHHEYTMESFYDKMNDTSNVF